MVSLMYIAIASSNCWFSRASCSADFIESSVSRALIGVIVFVLDALM